jgi:DNA-binding transcriptional regulator WhiA
MEGRISDDENRRNFLIVAFLFNGSVHSLVSAFGNSPYCDVE